LSGLGRLCRAGPSAVFCEISDAALRDHCVCKGLTPKIGDIEELIFVWFEFRVFDTKAEFTALYRAEYGTMFDIVIRVVGVTLGGVLLYLYTGWAASYLWGLIFAACHAVQFPFLRSRLSAPTPRDVTLAEALFLLVQTAFIWLPTLLAAQADPALMLAGLLSFGATALYHIRRSDTALWLVFGQIVIFSVCLLYIAAHHLPRFDRIEAQLGVILVGVMAAAFFVSTMLAVRRARLDLNRAADWLAQERKMSAIGRLAGGIAHDFNNMLTVVKGNIELHDHLQDPAEKHAALKDALEAASRAEQVVAQLLIYARKAPSEKRLLDLADIMSDIDSMATRIVPDHIELSTYVAAGPLRAELDQAQCITAVLNLVRNAIEAMPQGGALALSCSAVTLRGLRYMQNGKRLAAGRYIELAVADTGAGIPADQVSKVTEPFFTTKGPGQGTGLGLAMSQGFAEDMGGGLAIETCAKGTRIALYLPMAQGAAEEAP